MTGTCTAASSGAIEAVGREFSAQEMLSVRVRSRAAVNDIGARMRVGMTEVDARALANRVLVEHGLRRGWHPAVVRFGKNTLKTFHEPSEAGVVLGERDIFFVDVGPVAGRYEGDAGSTFIRGDDREMTECARDVERVFEAVRSKWLADRLTGAGLYRYAEETAQSLGWRLNLDANGHRLSEFPHKAHYEGSLAGIRFAPTSLLWVLEIQIRHPTRAFGAFYEDLLIEEPLPDVCTTHTTPAR